MSTNTLPVPPQVEAAQEQLLAVIEGITKTPIDPLTTPWAEIEKSVIQVLGGAFNPQQPEHQVAALGLSGMWAARLMKDDGAFWFPNRDFAEGAGLGFSGALIMLSPMGAVVDALSRANLSRLDEVAREIRNSLAQAKFGTGGGQARLTPLDYQRLFDPGLLQFLALDEAKVQKALGSTPEALTRDLRDAIARANGMPAEAKQQLEAQLVGGLKGLEQTLPMSAQIERGSRLVELAAHLFGSNSGSGAAPEEFWTDITFPLLHIGAPANFPPLDEDVIQAADKVDPLFLFLDSVPNAIPAPEEGPFGIFEMDEIGLLHDDFNKVRNVRLLKVHSERFTKILAGFDKTKLQDGLTRFNKYLEEKSGKKPMTSGEGEQLVQGSLQLLSDLQKLASSGTLYVRRLTEAEALSEGAMQLVRQALNAPRIILT